MKKKWIDSMQYVDDQYVAEADPGKIAAVKKKSPRVLMAVAACVALITALGAIVAIPYFRKDRFSLHKYKDSEYYTLLQKLHALKMEEQDQEKEFGYDTEMDMLPEGSLTDDAFNDVSQKYEELTDNQVKGLIEADRIKRSDKYVYYLAEGGTLYIYSVAGESSKQIGKYRYTGGSKERIYAHQFEFFLSEDCKTVTMMIPFYSFEKGMDLLRIKQLDVSDPANIKEKNEVTVSGAYVSSRMTNGDFLVITEYSLTWDEVDYDDLTTCVPQVITNGKGSLIAAGNIMMPDKLSDAGYTVVARLKGGNLDAVGAAAFLSYSNDVYVSAENVFATREYNQCKKKDNLVTNQSYTEISRLSYTERDFTPKGSVSVEGYVKDRYSLDEYNGILRVVTTFSITQYREYTNGSSVSASDWNSNTSASLYCVSLDNMKVVSKVEAFAPSGETVQSVRYNADTAYVCTAVVFSDPVFFFDLSDINNITYKETETIDGFSSSLVDFNNEKLLGIGRLDWSTMKIEIYEEGEDDVQSISAYTSEDTDFSSNYKAYYIDRENQLIGLGVDSQGASYYIVLHFNGEKLLEVARFDLGGSNDAKRGFYNATDGFFYVFGENDFAFKKLTLK